MGGTFNGELLERAQHDFDVLVTNDANVSFQQNISQFDIAIVVLNARSSRLNDILRLIPRVQSALPILQPGEVIRITGPPIPDDN